MEDVKIHICPTCGGKLNVNIERQMYECPFCGVTFDYDYFREESVLDIASQSLINKEFTSADRAYDFLLEKEPDNFEALRGKALIAMNMPKIDDVCRIDRYSKMNYESACKEVGRAIESSKPQDREYFTTMKDIVDAGHEYVDAKSQLEAQRKERTKTIDILSEYVKEKDTVCVYSSSRIRKSKAIILTVVFYIICILLIIGGYMFINRNPYAKAEDLSQYETKQSSDSDNSDFGKWYTDHKKYEDALAKEEQRKINYEEWERNHDNSNSNLIGILITATVIYAFIVFLLVMEGVYLSAKVSKIQAVADEQTDKIRNFEKSMADNKKRIDQGYKRLCELHPATE